MLREGLLGVGAIFPAAEALFFGLIPVFMRCRMSRCFLDMDTPLLGTRFAVGKSTLARLCSGGFVTMLSSTLRFRMRGGIFGSVGALLLSPGTDVGDFR